MPEGYTHLRTARLAAQAMNYKVRCPAAFDAGANGPDDLFCFEILKKPAKRRYDLPTLGNRMHNDKTGAFLQSLIDHVSTGAQIEYTLGFLSHYAVDTVVHPYVVALCAPGMPYGKKGGHGYFEIALDSTLHGQDTGDAVVPVADSSPALTGTQLAEVCALLHTALLETYGEDVPVEYLADAFFDVTKVRGCFASRHHIKYGVFWLLEGLAGHRGFVTGHVSPRKLKPDLPREWKDPATGADKQADIGELLAQAQMRSITYMQTALSYWMHKLTKQQLQDTLGSMDYLTGTPTRASAPELDWPPEETPEPKPETPKENTAEAPAPPETQEATSAEPEVSPEPQSEAEPETPEAKTEEATQPTAQTPETQPQTVETAPTTPAEPETKPIETPSAEPESPEANPAETAPAAPASDASDEPDEEATDKTPATAGTL